ncbi:Prolyl 4-hydroxylase subunit alpha-3 [Mactra antiquata]
MARLVQLLGLFLCILCPSVSELYSSVGKLHDVFQQLRADESRPLLKHLITQQENRLDKIKSLAKTLRELSGQEIRDPEFTVHHPLDAFRFIRNHSIIFNITTTEMLKEIHLYKQGRIVIESLLKNITIIGVDDLKGIIRGILEIQITYDLTTKDMANGKFGSLKVEPLSAAECQDIMVVAYLEKRYDTAKEWFNMAVNKMDEEGDRMTTTPLSLLTRAAEASATTGNYLEAVHWYSEIVAIEPNSRYHKYKLRVSKKMLDEYNNSPNQDQKTLNDLENRFIEGCQGKVPRLLGPVPKRLYCDFDDNGHAFLLIQPVRRELISLDPYIVVYHNVLSKKTIMSIREDFKPRVTNYGIGGQYFIHADYFDDMHQLDNRIATFMLYMSDVEMGGGTNFPYVPEVVYPQMGSAVFWYNLYPNNTSNQLTKHGGCPVAIGDKWIANIWIRLNGNEFTKPCPLDANEKSWTKYMKREREWSKRGR